jgi:hypothetical protein
MESLMRISEVLLLNIVHNQANVKQSLINDLKAFKNPVIKPLINISHIKTHKNLNYEIIHCALPHCLECLSEDLESNQCPHGQHITLYEKVKIKHLASLIQNSHLQSKLLKKKYCFTCNEEFKLAENKKLCVCQCSECVIRQYDNLVASCFKCGTKYDYESISEIAEDLYLDPIKAIKACPDCKLTLYAKGFDGNKCFICAEAQKFGNKTSL